MMIAFLALFLFGASMVSFFCLFVERRNVGEDFILERSHCNFCGKKLGVVSLIPFFNYIFLKGKSTCCHRSIPARYFFLEGAGGLVFSFSFYKAESFYEFLWYGFAFLFLMLPVIEDLFFKDVYLLDVLGIFLLLIIAAIHLHGRQIFLKPMVFIFVLFYSIHSLFPKGIGEGDAWAGALMAFSTETIEEAFLYFATSFFLAAILGIFLLLMGKGKKTEIPMIPFLFLGSFFNFFLGG